MLIDASRGMGPSGGHSSHLILCAVSVQAIGGIFPTPGLGWATGFGVRQRSLCVLSNTGSSLQLATFWMCCSTRRAQPHIGSRTVVSVASDSEQWHQLDP